MKHVTFLTALCIAVQATHAMDKPEYIIPQAMTTHKKLAQTLWLSTHCMLTDFNRNEKNTRKELVNIIERMNSLKLAQPPVTEKEIGFYLYQQKNDVSMADSFKNTLFGSTPMPIAKSIFFARLAQYNNDLEKKSLISPNEQQVKNYFKKIALDDLVAKNAQYNIIVPQQTIDAVTLLTPTTVGAKEFALLLDDIKALLNNYSLQEMYQTAELIYHDYLHPKQ